MPLLSTRSFSVFIVFSFFALICACKHSSTSKLSSYHPVLEKVMRSETGAFRGLNLGNTQDSVKKSELSQPVESDNGYLYYEYKLDDTTGSYSITYNFDDKGLNEIQTDIYITNSNNTEAVFNAFKSYFDDHYGSSEMEMGYNVWTVKSPDFGDVKINLSDESASLTTDHAPGKIAVWIYPDKN